MADFYQISPGDTRTLLPCSGGTADEALDYIDRWLARPVTTVIDPTPRHASGLRDLPGGFGTAGNLVSDAHIAALAIEHGAELCSTDHDFGRFPGLRWVNPLIT